MDKISKIYYINLERRPDRKEHFLKVCNDNGLPQDKIVRFEAIDAKIYQMPENESAMFRNADYLKYPYKDAVMCNQLSHFKILQEMVKNEYPFILVFQDDAKLRDGFLEYINGIIEKLPKDAEMVNLGLHEHALYNEYIPWDLNSKNDDSRIAEEIINPWICKLEHDKNPCSLSYIMTLQGAKNMVAYYTKKGFWKCTDHAFNDYLKERDIFYGSRKVLVTSAVQFGSDIFPT